MSLLDDAFEEFVIQDRQTQDDGYGGVVTTWVNGAEINGALVYDSSSQFKVAQALGSTSSYTLTVRKNVSLDYHMVLKRKADGKVFRVVADSDENRTPDSAALDMLQYSLEEWKLN